MASSPNILLIISDDWSWTDYSFMGHPDIKTPHIDKFAKESVLFKRGYVPTALCRPSLATLQRTRTLQPTKLLVTIHPPNTRRNSKLYNERRAKIISFIDNFDTLPNYFPRNYLSHQSGKYWEGNYKRAGFTWNDSRLPGQEVGMVTMD